MDTATSEPEAPDARRARMSMRAWLWSGLALATSALVAILFAVLPFTIDRVVNLRPPELLGPSTGESYPTAQVMHIRCSPQRDYYVGSTGVPMGFNGASPSPIESPSSFCDPAQADRTRLAPVLPIFTALAIAAFVLTRTRRRHQTSRHRRWALAGGSIGAGSLLAVVVMFTGVPYLRPPLRDAQAVVDKINRCSLNAARIDWVTGMVITTGEPVNPAYALTDDERELIKANGKVGLCLGPIR
jgi:hypothetical protein